MATEEAGKVETLMKLMVERESLSKQVEKLQAKLNPTVNKIGTICKQLIGQKNGYGSYVYIRTKDGKLFQISPYGCSELKVHQTGVDSSSVEKTEKSA